MGKVKDWYEQEIAEMSLARALRSGGDTAECSSQTGVKQDLSSSDHVDEWFAFVFEEVVRNVDVVEITEEKAIGTTIGHNNG